MKFGQVLIFVMLNMLCVSAMGQGSENPFGSATSNSISTDTQGSQKAGGRTKPSPKVSRWWDR